MLSFFASYLDIALIFLAAAALSSVFTRLVLAFALRMNWVTVSNDRSSHVGRLAYGGGISVISVALGMWVILAWPFAQIHWVVLVGAILLAGISWLDDLKGMSSRLRMGVHFAVVAICLMFLPSQQNILPFDWPLYVDRIFAGFFWIWFINLFNFMDGIDGLAGVETLFIALGVFVVGALGTIGAEWQILALVIGASAVGFLPWNWHKARIMLGDIGAVPLGFLLGFLLIQLALQGFWVAALVLPLYFVADATITILRRLTRGEKIWEAHRTHFYQRACSPTKGHDRVVIRVAIANAILLGLAVFSMTRPVESGVLAILVVAGLLISLLKLTKE